MLAVTSGTDRVRAVVDITAEPAGCTLEELVVSAYRASRDGVVVLVLSGVSPAEVDRILDPVVPSMPLTIPGVRYLQATDEEAVRRAYRSAAALPF